MEHCSRAVPSAWSSREQEHRGAPPCSLRSQCLLSNVKQSRASFFGYYPVLEKGLSVSTCQAHDAGARDSPDSTPRAAKASKTDPQTHTACLKVTADSVALIHDGFLASTVPADCVARSKLLEEVLATAEASEVSSIPVTPAAFSAWIRYLQVDPFRSSTSLVASEPGKCPTPAHNDPGKFVDGTQDGESPLLEKMQDLCELLQV